MIVMSKTHKTLAEDFSEWADKYTKWPPNDRLTVSQSFTGHTILDLHSLITHLENIQAEWDGDEAGIEEERAGIASDAKYLAQQLIEKLEELDDC